MIDHIWTVVCKQAVVDSLKNDLYLHSILEGLIIFTEPKPGGILRTPITIVTYWCRSDPERPAIQRFRLIFASSSTSNEIFTGEIDLTNDMRHRYILEVAALPVSESGQHNFFTELEINLGQWERVATIPLDIEFHPEMKERESKEASDS